MDFSRILKNSAYRRIMRFFHENPASIDTGRGVATWTNQDIKTVRASLKKLASLGLLVAHRVSSTTGYSYTRDKNIVRKIARLLEEHE